MRTAVYFRLALPGVTCHPSDDDDETSRYYFDLQVTPGSANLKYTAVRMELRLTAQVSKTGAP